MNRAALSKNQYRGAARSLGTAPVDLFFAVITLGIAFALGVALCLWRADTPLHDDALRDVGQTIERPLGETVL